MKKVFSALLLAVFSITHVYTQTPVGHRFDVNGMPFFGHFDSFTYQPKKGVSFTHQSNSFELGYYYTRQLVKVEGQIKFDDDKIIFKNEDGKGRIRLKPEDINSFVIGIDSFFVTSNFYRLDRLRSEPEFVQFISNYDGFTFAKNYLFTSGVSQTYGGRSAVVTTYIVKREESEEWDNFSDTNFKKTARDCFGSIPILNQRIEDGRFDEGDVLSLIKMGYYYHHYMDKSSIYLNKYWQEILSAEKAAYSATIDHIEDTIWTISYYENKRKIYQIDYSSFYPHVKNGACISYHANGKIRQVVNYKNDEKQEVKIFDQNDDLQVHYRFAVVDSTKKGKEYEIAYEFISRADGKNALAQDLKTSIVLEQDNESNPSYTYVFKGKRLISSYRLHNEDTVFQIIDPKSKIGVKSIQSNFEVMMRDMKYDIALSENAEGTMLVSFLIDQKGYALDYKILNSLHPEYNRAVKSFVLNKIYTRKDDKHRFKSYKINKKKQYYDLVIPFQFSIRRYYRAPAHNYYYDPNFHNNAWMFQNSLDHIEVPDFSNFPSHF